MAASAPPHSDRVVAARRWLVRVGLTLVVPSSLYFALGLVGLVPTEPFALGPSSGLRTIASLAVLGCLLAAIGYWDDAKD